MYGKTGYVKCLLLSIRIAEQFSSNLCFGFNIIGVMFFWIKTFAVYFSAHNN